MSNNDYDFSGWATRSGVRCADGVTIMPDAFKHCDNATVPLVWNHNHSSPENVIGKALLKNIDGDIYAYGSFNKNRLAKAAKTALQHGDLASMSICANQLKKSGQNVVHGTIREVSLVLAGANPRAHIEEVLVHSADGDEERMIWVNDDPIENDSMLEHAVKIEKDEEELKMADEKKMMNDSGEETIGDVFNTLSEKQKNAVYAIVGQLIEDERGGYSRDDDEEDDDEMKHNLFDMSPSTEEDTLMHDAMTTIIGDAKRYGSLKESFLQHADTYGIDQIEYLFPEAKTTTTTPEFIQRDMSWVDKVMGAVHHTPFSRVKSVFANITEDDARARGYMKGKLKKEEVFSLLKRSTDPTTVYKKQKLDRDDVIDITDFDVVSWLKTEMRMMLNEELARAYLVGDGRLVSSDDKINENNIRPIWTDAPLYTIKAVLNVKSADTSDTIAKAFIRAAIKARKDYKGSGQPTMFTTEDVITDCLLLEDTTGRRLYSSVQELATVLRVKEIVSVPIMEGLKRHDNEDSKDHNLMALIVNLADYNVGADKGGAINMFDDFDIDYNQQKYLIETRCSGALIKPYSAIAIETVVEG